MIEVGLFSAHEPQLWLRQTAASDGIWANIKVLANPEDGPERFIVVYDVPKNNFYTKVPKHNRILFLTEPPGSKFYSPLYLSQFGLIISPFILSGIVEAYVKSRGSKLIYEQACLPWHAGIDFSVQPHRINKTYSDFLNLQRPENPRHRLSIVTSNKRDRPEQVRRFALVKELQQQLGKDVVVFGRGYNEISDKFDAIYNSHFHLVLENNFEKNFWTEKLSDSFLCWSYPIYLGTSFIREDFPKDSYFQLDPQWSIADTVDRILRRLRENLLYKDIAAMTKARSMIINDYNLFPTISRLIKQLPLEDRLQRSELIVGNFDPRPKIIIKKLRRTISAKIRSLYD